MNKSIRGSFLQKSFIQGIIALVVNIVFFLIVNSRVHLVMLNDDVYLAAFFNGAFAERSAYTPYVNYVLSLLLDCIYALSHNNYPCFSLFLIVALIMSFSMISRICMKKFGTLRGISLTVVLLSLYAFDAYCCITYTTVSFFASVAGITGLFLAWEEGIESNEKNKSKTIYILSAALALTGFMLRSASFIAVFALLLPIGLYLTAAFVLRDSVPPLKLKLIQMAKLCIPFAILLGLAAVVWAIDAEKWSAAPYNEWIKYNDARTEVYDYTDRVPYDEAPEMYEAIGLSRNDVEMLHEYKLGDAALANLENFSKVADLSRGYYGQSSFGKNLIKMIKTLFQAVLHKSYAHALGLIVLVWAITGKHDKISLISAAAWIIIFLAEYMVLVYIGRYAYDRVDSGMFLTGFVVFSFLLRDEHSHGNTAVLLAASVAAIFLRCAVTPAYLTMTEAKGKSAEVEQSLKNVEFLVNDTDYLYIDNVLVLSGAQFLPYAQIPEGALDRIAIMKGWPSHLPIVEKTLRTYGISNPYSDCIGRDDVRIIDGHIETTVAYIREHYNANASAVLDKRLSDKTGWNIYLITG